MTSYQFILLIGFIIYVVPLVLMNHNKPAKSSYFHMYENVKINKNMKQTTTTTIESVESVEPVEPEQTYIRYTRHTIYHKPKFLNEPIIDPITNVITKTIEINNDSKNMSTSVMVRQPEHMITDNKSSDHI